MKKQILISIIFITAIILISFFLIIKPTFTGNILLQEQKIKLGYCSTMQEEAISLSEKNNYQLIEFGSATQVLSALQNNQINKALIGRKAKGYEISKDTSETILDSEYTLVSNKKSFIEYSSLSDLDIYTYLPKEVIENLIVYNFKIINLSKQEAINKISKGKLILISWEDWSDNFELVVVMNRDEKVKDFRGVFLYEN